jgi:hypothetical protein
MSRAQNTIPEPVISDVETQPVPRQLKRKKASANLAGKGPAYTSPQEVYDEEDIDSSEVDTMPSLDQYFDQFEVDFGDRIKLCRAYASYLAATLKSRTK